MTMTLVYKLVTSRLTGLAFAAFILFAGFMCCTTSQSYDTQANTMATFRTTDLQVDNTETVGGVSTFSGVANFVADVPATAKFGILAGGVPGGYTYITDNTLNFGYEINGTTTGYINYDGYHGGTSQFRDLCITDGKETFPGCMIYTQGILHRVGVNTSSPTKSLDVVGDVGASGLASLSGGVTTSTGDLHVGDAGGFSSFFVGGGHTNGIAYWQQGTTIGGFGFGNNSNPICPVDIHDYAYSPSGGPRTDSNPTMQQGISTGNYDTTAGNMSIPGVFFDMSPVKTAGANSLSSVTMRLDNRGPDHSTALWVDEGEFSIGTHTTYSVRPTSPISAPPQLNCGAGPAGTVAGNDNKGRISVGGGVVASCVLTFQTGWVDHTAAAIVPSCMVQSESGIALTYTPLSGSLTIAGAALQGTFINYDCGGADNNIPQIGP